MKILFFKNFIKIYLIFYFILIKFNKYKFFFFENLFYNEQCSFGDSGNYRVEPGQKTESECTKPQPGPTGPARVHRLRQATPRPAVPRAPAAPRLPACRAPPRAACCPRPARCPRSSARVTACACAPCARQRPSAQARVRPHPSAPVRTLATLPLAQRPSARPSAPAPTPAHASALAYAPAARPAPACARPAPCAPSPVHKMGSSPSQFFCSKNFHFS